VSARHHKRDDLAINKYRTGDLHVRLMVTPAQVGVVADDHIARAQVVSSNRFHRHFGGYHGRTQHGGNVITLRYQLHMRVKHRR